MALSSSTLFHFTSKKGLSGIIKSDFQIKYCKESIETKSRRLQFASPVVCFCDIPLSKTKEHITKYGSYAIGLSKEWAKRKGLNPVLYIDTESDLSVHLEKIFNMIRLHGKEKDLEKMIPLLTLFRYTKNYESTLIRKKETIKDYRFADEKEWRYVPYIDEKINILPVLPISMYDTDAKKAVANEKIKHLTLSFDADDIKYIIVKNESEISEFIELLRNSKSKKYTYQSVERLMTRILTVEQIINDF